LQTLVGRDVRWTDEKMEEVRSEGGEQEVNVVFVEHGELPWEDMRDQPLQIA